MSAGQPLTPAQRSLRGRLAVNSRWARTSPDDRAAATQAATAASPVSLDRWERDVDPDGRLEPADRRARAVNARRAYMQGLALRSSRARAARATRRDGGAGGPAPTAAEDGTA